MKEQIEDVIWAFTMTVMIMVIFLSAGCLFIALPAMLIIKWLGIE